MRQIRLLVAAAAACTAVLLPGSPASAATVVASWHMNEGAGASRMHDASGHDNDGTLSGVRSGVDGYAASGYYFTEPAAAVTVRDSASLDPGSARITIDVHLLSSATMSHDWNVLQKGRWATRGGQYKVTVVPRDGGRRGYARCVFNGSQRRGIVTGGPNLLDGRWHDVRCIKTATQVRLAVDGRVIARNVSVGRIANDSPLTIGAKSRSGGDQYVGKVDEVAVTIG